ncbi:MAG: hypothetical protein WC829_23350 [Hyphomicrobium sp.]
MATKSKIVAELGEADLVLPDRIGEALTANDHVKYYFALLQTARANADHPAVPVPDLKAERLASAVNDDWLDGVVAETRRPEPQRYAVPRIDEILDRISAGIAAMLACLPDDQQAALRERLETFDFKLAKAGVIAGNAIDAMTSGDLGHGDSPHLLVMDAHKAINVLQAATATESVLGASTRGLSEHSKRLVASFMTGLNRTAPLKFDHPGLATTATEHDGRLLIQNDIGTTDAHVLVVRVTGLETSLTYTDIHSARLKFFVSLFAKFAVDWQRTDNRTSDVLENKSYILTTGVFRAADEAELGRYLDHLGSRIVFLIDWNKMRKRLRAFVSKERAVEVLRWAAEHDVGHRALLEAGGEQVLAEAVEFATGDTLRYGDRLDNLIGEDNATRFLRRAMEVASIGLRQGRSRRLIADEIKAELKRYFETTGLAILDLAARHAEAGFDLAVTLRDALENLQGGTGAGDALARRAVQWEHRADQLLNEARDDIKRHQRPVALLRFFERADDAVDELEEAASLSGLLPPVAVPGAPMEELRGLADTVLACAQEFIKSIECAAAISRSDVCDDFDDFLSAFSNLMDLEHRADDLLRAIRRALAQNVESARAIYLIDLVSGSLESATDAYLHATQALRAYLMEEVIA